jgi:hypothetical protein
MRPSIYLYTEYVLHIQLYVNFNLIYAGLLLRYNTIGNYADNLSTENTFISNLRGYSRGINLKMKIV